MRAATKAAFWVGGLLVAAAATATAAYAITEQTTKPQAPAGPAFQPGGNYLLSAQIPTNVKTVADLTAALSAEGFSNITILYFGPQGLLQSQAGLTIPFSVTSTNYVAQATYSGASALAVPAGVSMVQL
jgi:hypothetical protein